MNLNTKFQQPVEVDETGHDWKQIIHHCYKNSNTSSLGVQISSISSSIDIVAKMLKN